MKPQFILHGNRKSQNCLMAFAFLCLFTVSAAVFTACDKQSPLAVDEQSLSNKPEAKPEIPSDAKVITFNPETVRFSYQGKLYPKEEFHARFKGKEFPVMMTGTGLPEENVVYVFDSEADVDTWGKTTRMADQFVQLSQKLSAAKQQSQVKGAPNANRIQSLGGSATLYDGYTQTGTPFYRAVTSLVPTLGSFDNRASSLQIYNPPGGITVCAVYSSTYYTGTQFIFWNNYSNYVARLNDMGIYGWNNITSSFIVL
jgi:hypothetical protein